MRDRDHNNEEKNNKKKKKDFKVRYVFGGLALVGVVVASAYAFGDDAMAFGSGLIGKFGGNKNTDPNDLLSFVESVPNDQEGIRNITYQLINRTLNESNGVYSLPSGYDYVYVGDDENRKPILEPISMGDKDSGITNFECTNGSPTEVIGLQHDYADFLKKAEDIKKKALEGNQAYATELVKVEREVDNLYELANGYSLYCEDKAIANKAKFAYLATDGDSVYEIPKDVLDEFVGVTNDAYKVIVKYDEFKTGVADMYQVYEGNVNYGKSNEETNLTR